MHMTAESTTNSFTCWYTKQHLLDVRKLHKEE
jgi:hypothetical protein